MGHAYDGKLKRETTVKYNCPIKNTSAQLEREKYQ